MKRIINAFILLSLASMYLVAQAKPFLSNTNFYSFEIPEGWNVVELESGPTIENYIIAKQKTNAYIHIFTLDIYDKYSLENDLSVSRKYINLSLFINNNLDNFLQVYNNNQILENTRLNPKNIKSTIQQINGIDYVVTTFEFYSHDILFYRTDYCTIINGYRLNFMPTSDTINNNELEDIMKSLKVLIH